MKCYNHPEIEALGVCSSCGKAVCEDCVIDADGKLICNQCADSKAKAASIIDLSERKEIYLSSVTRRLKTEGFDCTEEVSFGNSDFKCVAKRTKFKLSKFGFSETFFIFGEFSSLDTNSLKNFSSKCFQYAKEARSIRLPCGFFESVWCFSVAIVDSIDAATAEAVRNAAPTKHFGAAEIPVIYDCNSNTLYYFEKTPMWGAAYYAGFRKLIQKLLAP